MNPDEERDAPPSVRDFHGNFVDPRTGKILRNDPGSIFSSSNNNEGDNYIHFDKGAEENTLPDLLQRLNGLGLRPKQMTLLVTPSPSTLAAPVTRPPSRNSFQGDEEDLYEISGGNTFRSTCGYCWQVSEGRQRPRGFTVKELDEAAKSGCDTCDILQRSVRHFGNLVFGYSGYTLNKVRVEQEELASNTFKTGLLSHANRVLVHFDEHGGETLELEFQDSDHPGFTGRLPSAHQLIEDTSTSDATKLIKDWIHTCDETHLECSVAPTSPLPKRVLQISSDGVRVVSSMGKTATYLTLSHCWGTTQYVRLTFANLDEMEKNVPWPSLSRTFKDAIILTANLGYQYLWIDSLCIIQDSKEDWELHASKMADIYTKSFLTISASRGENGDRGLFGHRTEEPLRLVYSDLKKIQNPRLWQPYRTIGRDRDGCVRNISVLLKRPHGLYEDKKPKEPLLKRAWVFQEQILSPRLIHFASGELYFECKSHVACECQGWEKRTASSQWETRWKKAHSVLLSSSGLDLEPRPNKNHAFEAYRAIVESYTQLDITQELDRLPALSGVTFGRTDIYLAGMWESLLVESLHWCPSPVTTSGMMARRPHVWRGPTWSWVSMECPIRHCETRFGIHRHDSKLLATILNVSCTPEGLDPRGRVSNAWMKIQGPVAGVKVTDIGFCSREVGWKTNVVTDSHYAGLLEPTKNQWDKPDLNCTFATLAQGDVSGRCFLDVPLSLCRNSPAEVAVGDHVGLLLLSSTIAIVVKPATKPGAFVRVGYYRREENNINFFNSNTPVVLV